MYLNEIEVGTRIDIPAAVIDKQKLLDFARLYDPIPLHLDEEYAKMTRFGGLIAPGVMSFMTVWAKYIEVDIIGDALVAGKSTYIEWIRPVYPGDTLKAEAIVTAITPRNPYNGLIEITITARNQHGEIVLTDVAKAVVKYRQEEKMP